MGIQRRYGKRTVTVRKAYLKTIFTPLRKTPLRPADAAGKLAWRDYTPISVLLGKTRLGCRLGDAWRPEKSSRSHGVARQ